MSKEKGKFRQPSPDSVGNKVNPTQAGYEDDQVFSEPLFRDELSKSVRRKSYSNLTPSEILKLQRTIGNQAVMRLLNLDRKSGTPLNSKNHNQNSSHPNLARRIHATVTTTHAAQIVQRNYSLSDYKDPSRVGYATIANTKEFEYLLNLRLKKTIAPEYSVKDIYLACRLIIRHLQEGKAFVLEKQGVIFLERAHKQLGTLNKIQEMQTKDPRYATQNSGLIHTDFGKWLLKGEAEPDPQKGTMNCWEAILFGAFKAGYAKPGRLKEFYNQFNGLDMYKISGTFDQKFEEYFKAGEKHTFVRNDPKSPEPLPGDIVTFVRAFNHTTISLGTRNDKYEHEILSLWDRPGNAKFLQKTTIETLYKEKGAEEPIEFWSPDWS